MQLAASVAVSGGILGLALLALVVFGTWLFADGRRLIGGAIAATGILIALALGVAGNPQPGVIMISVALILGGFVIDAVSDRRAVALAVLAAGWMVFAYALVDLG